MATCGWQRPATSHSAMRPRPCPRARRLRQQQQRRQPPRATMMAGRMEVRAIMAVRWEQRRCERCSGSLQCGRGGVWRWWRRQRQRPDDNNGGDDAGGLSRSGQAARADGGGGGDGIDTAIGGSGAATTPSLCLIICGQEHGQRNILSAPRSVPASTKTGWHLQ